MKMISLGYYIDSTYEIKDFIQVNPQNIISKKYNRYKSENAPYHTFDIKLSDGTMVNRVFIWEEIEMAGFNIEDNEQVKIDRESLGFK